MNSTNPNESLDTDSSVSDAEKINPGHERKRKKLRKIGIICIVVGLPLSCIPFVGMPLLFAGLVMTMYGYAGAMARYQAAEIAPVQKDTFNYVADGTQEGVKTAAKAVGEGLGSGLTAGGMNAAASETEVGVRCYKCNFLETSDAKFCSACGAAMEKSKACPQCNELNDPDAKFCDNCGGTF